MDAGTLFFEFARPGVWPPVVATSFQRIRHSGGDVDFLCFPDGHLALIANIGGHQTEYHFQRVNIPEWGIVKIAATWGAEGVVVAACGELLSRLDDSQGRVLDVKVKGYVSYAMGVISFAPAVLDRASREEWLFLMTLVDVSRKINNPSRYELIRLSALIRQLLCDSAPLIYVINRKYRVRIEFEVAIKTKAILEEAGKPQTSWLTLFPASPEEVERVDLERFLKLQTITHRGVTCDVSDVIDIVAHVFGGVHYGEVRSESSGALEILGNEVFLANESMVLHLLFDIGRVVLRGAMPLAEAIVKSYA